MLALVLGAGILAGCAELQGEEEILPSASVNLEATEYYTVDDVFSLNCSRQDSFNPITTSNNDNFLCSQLMYDNIFEVDSSFQVSSRIISEFRSDDGINWFFYVDTGVSFWDGGSVTAYDVAYSLRRAMQSTRFRSRLSVVQGVSAMDEELVMVSTYKANTQLPALMTVPVIRDGSEEEQVPMGTGPYQPNQALTEMNAYLGNRDSLPLDTVYLKEVTGIEEGIAAFEDSALDMVLNDPSSFTNLGYGTANDIRGYPTTNMHYLGFNSSSRYFSNLMFRRAMNYVINREDIVTTALKGNATESALPINPSSSLYNSSYAALVSYSLAKSEEALETAEVQDYDDDGRREIMITGIPVEIDISFIVSSDSSQKVAAARQIAAGLEELGITVTLRELPWDSYIAALSSGDFDMFYAETMLTADFDPSPLMLSGGSINYGVFSDTGLADAVTAYLSADDAGRKRAADLMCSTIVDISPIISICFERHQVITHRGAVGGMKPSQYNVFHNIEEWTMDFD